MAESMKGLKRTHRCAELSAANIGETVTIMGWVQKNRNKGGLVFVDVRDRSGIIQIVCEEGKTDAAVIEKATKLRSEYVVAVVGTVAKRSGAVKRTWQQERSKYCRQNFGFWQRLRHLRSTLKRILRQKKKSV